MNSICHCERAWCSDNTLQTYKMAEFLHTQLFENVEDVKGEDTQTHTVCVCVHRPKLHANFLLSLTLTQYSEFLSSLQLKIKNAIKSYTYTESRGFHHFQSKHEAA